MGSVCFNMVLAGAVNILSWGKAVCLHFIQARVSACGMTNRFLAKDTSWQSS